MGKCRKAKSRYRQKLQRLGPFSQAMLYAAVAQVVQLGTAHITAALDFDLGDQRAVGLERTLNTFAAGDLAHGEATVDTAIALGDHDTFVGLQALAGAFDHVHAHDDRVAGCKFRDGLAEAGNFFRLEGLDQVHVYISRSCPRQDWQRRD